VAQKEEGNTTAYLDKVDVPPVINKGPRRVNKGNDSDDGLKGKVPLTDLSASAANGLRSENKVEGNVVYIEDVMVERVFVTSV
jgi:hypothetical protein